MIIALEVGQGQVLVVLAQVAEVPAVTYSAFLALISKLPY